MKKNLMVVLFPLLLLGCKEIVCNSEGTNSVRYFDFFPDTTVTSVDSTGYNSTDSCYYPLPTNSTHDMLVDVDDDGFDDFKIAVSHYKYGADSNLCGNYSSFVKIFGTNSGNSIAVNSGTKMVAAYDLNETIAGEWSGDATINANPNAFGNSFPNGSNYIGFKIMKDGSLHMGWIKLTAANFQFTLEALGYNDAGGNCIKAGEL